VSPALGSGLRWHVIESCAKTGSVQPMAACDWTSLATSNFASAAQLQSAARQSGDRLSALLLVFFAQTHIVRHEKQQR
jgi:hypothetical protein